ncbi:MAG: S9 family peptidase [Flavobacteriales bacterium]|nr:S9 family peptidase [Flavobacteriales bacterium]
MTLSTRFLSALSLALVVCTATAQKPFTYQEMLMLDRIGALNVDATGHYALFNVRATDMEKNKGVSSLWLKDLSMPTTPEMRLTISDGGAADAQWAPDGRTIYFLSRREGGVNNVWKIDITAKTPEQVTRLPLDVGAYRITPDGKGLVLSLAVFPECMGDEIGCTVQKLAERAAQKASGTVYTKLFVRHWDVWADGTRNHLFHVPLDGPLSKPVSLMPGFDGDCPTMPFGGAEDFWIAPDSRTVYFSARTAGTTEPWSTNFDIHRVDITGRVMTNLTEVNNAWDAHPRVSPDGTTLAYKAMKRPGFEADRFSILLHNIATGALRTLAADWDRSVDDLQWSRDGKSLLVTAGDVGTTRLFRIDVKSGAVTALSKGGHIDAFAETPTGFVYLKSALNSPSQLYASKPKSKLIEDGATNLTNVNPQLKTLQFGAFEQFSFAGWNNEKVYGYVVKPVGYVEGKKYPVAFLIHGGPQGSFGDGWSYRWNPETYAGAGYAVVMIDFHGSTGYGQAFCDAISQHWGDRPLQDLQAGWNYALKTYPFLDGERAAALGASYGGYMVNWIAGNWKAPWKCLVSHDGVFDSRSMGFTTEELWFDEWENGAKVFENPAAYDTFNPMLHAKDWSVPMLVIHSDLDYRIPVEQGIGVFTALQSKGVPSALLRFPDENHWVLKPQNSMLWHDTVFGWLKEYIGKEGK